MRAKLQGTFDLTAPMPKMSEDDVKVQRILMDEMRETGQLDEVPQYLIDYRSKMKRDKWLKRQRKWDDEQ